MTDLRKLAERITREVLVANYSCADDEAIIDRAEHMLREDREALVADLYRRSFCDPPNETFRRIFWEDVMRVLEGGEQAQPSNAAGEVVDSSRPDTEHPTSALPAAPDPHEFEEYAAPIAQGLCSICDRPADDPIHEVNDGVLQNDADRYWDSDSADPSNDLVDRAEPTVTVGPGDEVMVAYSEDSIGTVVGEHEGSIVALWDDGDYHDDNPSDLRTHDGRPVSGFDPDAGKSLFQRKGGMEMFEVCSKLDDAEDRITELERQLERAKQDRYDALSVYTKEGLLASEWVARAGRYKRERDEARAERDAIRRKYGVA